jgi:hypothetical protein
MKRSTEVPRPGWRSALRCAVRRDGLQRITTGTSRTQQALLELFCDACGQPQNVNIRDLAASTVTLLDAQTITGAKTFTAASRAARRTRLPHSRPAGRPARRSCLRRLPITASRLLSPRPTRSSCQRRRSGAVITFATMARSFDAGLRAGDGDDQRRGECNRHLAGSRDGRVVRLHDGGGVDIHEPGDFIYGGDRFRRERSLVSHVGLY